MREVQRRMAERGLSVYALAKRTGVHRSTLDEILAGHTNPRLDTMAKIADALGCRAADLLGETVGPQPVRMTQLKGAVEAGSWRRDPFWDPADRRPIPYHDPRFEGLETFALEVRDRSAGPELPPGTILICAAPAQAALPRTRGQYVVCQRRDETGRIEMTVQKYAIAPDGSQYVVDAAGNRSNVRDDGHSGVAIVAAVIMDFRDRTNW